MNQEEAMTDAIIDKLTDPFDVDSCDGCAHALTGERYQVRFAPDYVLCGAPYALEAVGTDFARRPLLVRPDHYCAAWAPKPQP